MLGTYSNIDTIFFLWGGDRVTVMMCYRSGRRVLCADDVKIQQHSGDSTTGGDYMIPMKNLKALPVNLICL